ncbi:hypothetical protein KMC57_gp05 [Achromobacter phage vB_AxyP_19-32_Axy24]|uniref:Uncharacterized protein n=1 Tax=Achromobacter phage vB_AxyP_19-32_Axy24 TaxID=2591048 RepID=A0A514CWC2_9CAUD|nr:hypothetical protein KMC57_gp05 [Achromobacter phage vB_AxyP_19-32_Axy24]QDH84765.1 hypothetical protein Axy24_005 [Achromobacter phage vB_AxyP_19-32_Axy24]
MKTNTITWKRTGGYEVSSQGDKRFSALYAQMPDGRTIEQWYQCDVKGYEIGGRSWKLGKGKPSLLNYEGDMQWQMYLNLWRFWAIHHMTEMNELAAAVKQAGNVISDRFAKTPINQAHALAVILNEWFS